MNFYRKFVLNGNLDQRILLARKRLQIPKSLISVFSQEVYQFDSRKVERSILKKILKRQPGKKISKLNCNFQFFPFFSQALSTNLLKLSISKKPIYRKKRVFKEQRHLENLKHLKSLEIEEVLERKNLKSLQKLKNLENVKIEMTANNALLVPSLFKNLTRLKEVKIRIKEATDAEKTEISSIKEASFSKIFFKSLGFLWNLEVLNLEINNFPSFTFEPLLGSLKVLALKEFNIIVLAENIQEIPSSDLLGKVTDLLVTIDGSSLKQFPNSQHQSNKVLSLILKHANSQSLSSLISRCTSLQTFTFSHKTQQSFTFEAFSFSPNLQNLSLETPINATFLSSISKALKGVISLEHVFIKSFIDSSFLEEFEQCYQLPCFTNLKSIDLTFKAIQSKKESPTGYVEERASTELLQILSKQICSFFSSVKDFALTLYIQNETILQALEEALKQMTDLTHLKIALNWPNNEKRINFDLPCESLSKNLISLNIEASSFFTPESAKLFASSMAYLENLEHINDSYHH